MPGVVPLLTLRRLLYCIVLITYLLISDSGQQLCSARQLAAQNTTRGAASGVQKRFHTYDDTTRAPSRAILSWVNQSGAFHPTLHSKLPNYVARCLAIRAQSAGVQRCSANKLVNMPKAETVPSQASTSGASAAVCRQPLPSHRRPACSHLRAGRAAQSAADNMDKTYRPCCRHGPLTSQQQRRSGPCCCRPQSHRGLTPAQGRSAEPGLAQLCSRLAAPRQRRQRSTLPPWTDSLSSWRCRSRARRQPRPTATCSLGRCTSHIPPPNPPPPSLQILL